MKTIITDENGARRNVKKRAKNKTEARSILKGILRTLDEEGSKSVELSKLTFNDLVDFYSEHFCKPAEYVDGKRIAGLCDVGRAKSCLARFRE